MNAWIEMVPHAPTKRDNSRYPFNELQLGQSFAMPRSEDHRIRAAAHSYATKHPDLRFTVARVIENGVQMTRCWRVK